MSYQAVASASAPSLPPLHSLPVWLVVESDPLELQAAQTKSVPRSNYDSLEWLKRFQNNEKFKQHSINPTNPSTRHKRKGRHKRSSSSSSSLFSSSQQVDDSWFLTEPTGESQWPSSGFSEQFYRGDFNNINQRSASSSTSTTSHKNKKPVRTNISHQSVNGLLSLLLLFGVSTCGCIGSIFIMSTLTVIESLQTRGNCYLVSLTLAQMLVTLFVIPSSALQIMSSGSRPTATFSSPSSSSSALLTQQSIPSQLHSHSQQQQTSSIKNVTNLPLNLANFQTPPPPPLINTPPNSNNEHSAIGQRAASSMDSDATIGSHTSNDLCHYQWLALEFTLVVSQLSFMLMAADNYLGYGASERLTAEQPSESPESSSSSSSPGSSSSSSSSSSSKPSSPSQDDNQTTGEHKKPPEESSSSCSRTRLQSKSQQLLMSKQLSPARGSAVCAGNAIASNNNNNSVGKMSEHRVGKCKAGIGVGVGGNLVVIGNDDANNTERAKELLPGKGAIKLNAPVYSGARKRVASSSSSSATETRDTLIGQIYYELRRLVERILGAHKMRRDNELEQQRHEFERTKQLSCTCFGFCNWYGKVNNGANKQNGNNNQLKGALPVQRDPTQTMAQSAATTVTSRYESIGCVSYRNCCGRLRVLVWICAIWALALANTLYKHNQNAFGARFCSNPSSQFGDSFAPVQVDPVSGQNRISLASRASAESFASSPSRSGRLQASSPSETPSSSGSGGHGNNDAAGSEHRAQWRKKQRQIYHKSLAEKHGSTGMVSSLAQQSPELPRLRSSAPIASATAAKRSRRDNSGEIYMLQTRATTAEQTKQSKVVQLVVAGSRLKSGDVSGGGNGEDADDKDVPAAYLSRSSSGEKPIKNFGANELRGRIAPNFAALSGESMERSRWKSKEKQKGGLSGANKRPRKRHISGEASQQTNRLLGGGGGKEEEDEDGNNIALEEDYRAGKRQVEEEEALRATSGGGGGGGSARASEAAATALTPTTAAHEAGSSARIDIERAQLPRRRGLSWPKLAYPLRRAIDARRFVSTGSSRDDESHTSQQEPSRTKLEAAAQTNEGRNKRPARLSRDEEAEEANGLAADARREIDVSALICISCHRNCTLASSMTCGGRLKGCCIRAVLVFEWPTMKPASSGMSSSRLRLNKWLESVLGDRKRANESSPICLLTCDTLTCVVSECPSEALKVLTFSSTRQSSGARRQRRRRAILCCENALLMNNDIDNNSNSNSNEGYDSSNSSNNNNLDSCRDNRTDASDASVVSGHMQIATFVATETSQSQAAAPVERLRPTTAKTDAKNSIGYSDYFAGSQQNAPRRSRSGATRRRRQNLASFSLLIDKSTTMSASTQTESGVTNQLNGCICCVCRLRRLMGFVSAAVDGIRVVSEKEEEKASKEKTGPSALGINVDVDADDIVAAGATTETNGPSRGLRAQRFRAGPKWMRLYAPEEADGSSRRSSRSLSERIGLAHVANVIGIEAGKRGRKQLFVRRSKRTKRSDLSSSTQTAANTNATISDWLKQHQRRAQSSLNQINLAQLQQQQQRDLFYATLFATVLGPILLAGGLFAKAYLRMKTFKMRPYKPMPVAALSALPLNDNLMVNSPLPVIDQRQVFTFEPLQHQRAHEPSSSAHPSKHAPDCKAAAAQSSSLSPAKRLAGPERPSGGCCSAQATSAARESSRKQRLGATGKLATVSSALAKHNNNNGAQLEPAASNRCQSGQAASGQSQSQLESHRLIGQQQQQSQWSRKAYSRHTLAAAPSTARAAGSLLDGSGSNNNAQIAATSNSNNNGELANQTTRASTCAPVAVVGGCERTVASSRHSAPPTATPTTQMQYDRPLGHSSQQQQQQIQEQLERGNCGKAYEFQRHQFHAQSFHYGSTVSAISAQRATRSGLASRQLNPSPVLQSEAQLRSQLSAAQQSSLQETSPSSSQQQHRTACVHHWSLPVASGPLAVQPNSSGAQVTAPAAAASTGWRAQSPSDGAIWPASAPPAPSSTAARLAGNVSVQRRPSAVWSRPSNVESSGGLVHPLGGYPMGAPQTGAPQPQLDDLICRRDKDHQPSSISGRMQDNTAAHPIHFQTQTQQNQAYYYYQSQRPEAAASALAHCFGEPTFLERHRSLPHSSRLHDQPSLSSTASMPQTQAQIQQQTSGEPCPTDATRRNSASVAEALANVIRSIDETTGDEAHDESAGDNRQVSGAQASGAIDEASCSDYDHSSAVEQWATSDNTCKDGDEAEVNKKHISLAAQSHNCSCKIRTTATTKSAQQPNKNKLILCTYSYMTDDQLLKSNVIVFIVNVTLWLPFILLSIATHYKGIVSAELRDTVWWFSALNCCSCSYIYALTNRDFRDAFNKLFYYCCCKSHVTFQRKTPVYRRQLDVDSHGNLRVHIIPGLNVHSNKLNPQPQSPMTPSLAARTPLPGGVFSPTHMSAGIVESSSVVVPAPQAVEAPQASSMIASSVSSSSTHRHPSASMSRRYTRASQVSLSFGPQTLANTSSSAAAAAHPSSWRAATDSTDASGAKTARKTFGFGGPLFGSSHHHHHSHRHNNSNLQHL